jgi:hypothetical protein
MTFFFGDGFDCYRDITDCGTYWDATFGGTATLALSASGRFTGSRGLVTISNGTPYIVKTSSVNDAIHHFSVAFQQTTAISGTSLGFHFTLYDGATAQCTVVFRNDGVILLTSGLVSGTILATYAAAFSAVNTWYQFEIEVVINNTTGSISVRRNGNTSNDFSQGSLVTRASANNYANKIGLGCFSSTPTQIIDDFLWRSDASSVAWIGDVRCYTRMPAADSAVQFTRSGSVVPVTPFTTGSSPTSGNITTGTARYCPFVTTCDGTIGTLSLTLLAGYTGNLKLSLFNNSASNTPGTVLASATTLTNPVLGSNTFTFSSPPSVTRGTTYWMGFNTDTTATNTLSTPSAVSGGYSGSAVTSTTTYASFPVATPTIAASGIAPGIFTANITPTTTANANLVAEVVQDAGAGYVLSSTNGQADLYTLQAAPSTPAVVIGVTTRGLFQKSDAGTRNATVQLKSGGVTVAGASTALPVGSWQWIARNDLVDPATSAAWTASGVNAALVGPSVTA